MQGDEVEDGPDAGRRSDLCAASVRLSLEALGIPRPPCPVALRFQVRNNEVVLVVRVGATATGGRFEAWVDGLDPDRTLTRDEGAAEHRWLTFEPVPARWAPVLNLFELRKIDYDPDDGAEVTLVGSRQDVQEFIEEARTKELDLREIQTMTAGEAQVLTDRQEQAARAAVDHGYYEVPRRISLTELADELDLSASSLSELLRRAEGRLLARYFGVGPPGDEEDGPLGIPGTVDPASPR